MPSFLDGELYCAYPRNINRDSGVLCLCSQAWWTLGSQAWDQWLRSATSFLVCHRFWASGWTPVPNAFEKTMWGIEPLTHNKCKCHVYYCPEIPLQRDAEWKDGMVMKAAPSFWRWMWGCLREYCSAMQETAKVKKIPIELKWARSYSEGLGLRWMRWHVSAQCK